jgi:hypothetical protein
MTELTQIVINVLNGGVDKIKPFTVGGQTIFPIYYKALAARMALSGSIEVKESSKVKYDPKEDVMSLNFNRVGVGDYREKALIVHEATHAVCDMIRMPINNDLGEVMAYVAQCQYFIGNFGNPNYTDPDSNMEAILTEATTIAQNIQSGGTPTAADYESLRAKIAVHKEYKKSAGFRAAFDGI